MNIQNEDNYKDVGLISYSNDRTLIGTHLKITIWNYAQIEKYMNTHVLAKGFNFKDNQDKFLYHLLHNSYTTKSTNETYEAYRLVILFDTKITLEFDLVSTLNQSSIYISKMDESKLFQPVFLEEIQEVREKKEAKRQGRKEYYDD